jgi:hypothetical protein
MTEANLLPFGLPAVCRKKLTVDFAGGNQSSDGGLLLVREAERTTDVCAARRQPDRSPRPGPDPAWARRVDQEPGTGDLLRLRGRLREVLCSS